MTYVCPNWYSVITISDEGETISDLFAQKDCSLTRGCTVSVDENGDPLDHEPDTYDDPYCHTHGEETRWYEADELWNHLAERMDNYGPGYVCYAHDWASEAMVFPDEELYLEHRRDEHGEDNEEDETEEAPAGTQPALVMAATCRRPHPRLTNAMRAAIRATKARTTYTAQGWLIATPENWDRTRENDRAIISNYGNGRDTERQIREWITYNWPTHFYIAGDDPHLNSNGQTSHTGWS